MKYFSNLDSIRSHPLPKWYDDCKLGIFIHWGLYSVPAFAPKSGQLGTIELDERWFANSSMVFFKKTLKSNYFFLLFLKTIYSFICYTDFILYFPEALCAYYWLRTTWSCAAPCRFF